MNPYFVYVVVQETAALLTQARVSAKKEYVGNE